MNKPKILLVDDEEGIRRQLKWALSAEYDVLEAGDKHAALRVLKGSKPKLIALDINLSSDSNDNREGMELLGDILSIDEVFVKESWRNQGICTKFLNELFEEFKDTVAVFRLEVTPSMNA